MRPATRDRFEIIIGEVGTATKLIPKTAAFDRLIEMMGHLLFGFPATPYPPEARKVVEMNANVAIGLVLEHYFIDHNETDIFNSMIRAFDLYPGLMRGSDIYLNAATVIGEVIDRIYASDGKVDIIAPNAGTGTVIMIVRRFLERDFSLAPRLTREIRYVGYVRNQVFRTIYLMNMMFSTREMVEKFMIGKALDAAGKDKLLGLYRKLAGTDSRYICVAEEGKLVGDNSMIVTDRRA